MIPIKKTSTKQAFFSNFYFNLGSIILEMLFINIKPKFLFAITSN